jgi:hypothetical protein
MNFISGSHLLSLGLPAHVSSSRVTPARRILGAEH